MKILMVYANRGMSSDGFRLILAILRREGHDLKIVSITHHPEDNFSDYELQQLGDISMETDLVMMGVYSVHEHHARVLTKYLKELKPERLVIWGGPHCIAVPEKSLQHADGVCYSEGDMAVPQFVRLLESGDEAYLKTPNMAFRVKGLNQINPLMPLISSLDALPFYDFSFENEWVLDKLLIPVTKEIFAKYCNIHPFKFPVITLLTSRGCPYNCTYCANIRYLKMYPGMKIRRQSLERLMQELKYTLSKLTNISYVLFGDDDFFDRTEEEISEFVKLYKKEIGLPCSIFISAPSYSNKKLSEWLQLDNTIIEMGVQSASQRVLKEVYNRPIPLKKIKEVITEISSALDNKKIKLSLDFIIDNPYETQSDILETYRFIAGLHKKIIINIFLLSFTQGSDLFEKAIKDKYISADDEFVARRYRSRDIKYQINYPMLIFLVWESFFFTRRLPLWLKLLPASPPFRFLGGLIPRSIIAWSIRNIPGKIRKLIMNVIGRNKNDKKNGKLF